MEQKYRALQRLADDMNRQGFARQAKRLATLLIKEATNIDVDFLNKVRDSLGDSIQEMEYYPPGAGQFPALQEIGVFYPEMESESSIKETLMDLGFTIQATVTSDFYGGTPGGASSNAAKKMQEPYFVIVATMEKSAD